MQCTGYGCWELAATGVHCTACVKRLDSQSMSCGGEHGMVSKATGYDWTRLIMSRQPQMVSDMTKSWDEKALAAGNCQRLDGTTPLA